MAKKLKSSQLIMGQVEAGRAPKEKSLAGFYSDTYQGQTGAVKKKAEETTEATRGLAGALDLVQTEGDDGKVKTTLKGDSKFRTNVAEVPGGAKPQATGTVAAADTVQGAAGDDVISGAAGTGAPAAGAGSKVTTPKQVAIPTLKGSNVDVTTLTGGELAAGVNLLAQDEKALTDAIAAAGGNVQEWKDSGASAADYINELNRKNAEAAGEAAKEAQERLTEKKLGARGQQSELEKQASDYTNIIASEPGTSNIKALANLTKFYDMGKYGALESGIRQGELALARQEAQSDLAAQQSAESMRAAAISEYGKQSKELGGILQSEVEAANEAERKRVADYYKTGLETAEEEKGNLETQLADVSGKREAGETKVKEEADKRLKTAERNIFGGDGEKGLVGIERKAQEGFDFFKKLKAGHDDTSRINKYKGFSKDGWHLDQMIRHAEDYKSKVSALMKEANQAREAGDADRLEKIFNAIKEEGRRYGQKLKDENSQMVRPKMGLK